MRPGPRACALLPVAGESALRGAGLASRWSSQVRQDDQLVGVADHALAELGEDAQDFFRVPS